MPQLTSVLCLPLRGPEWMLPGVLSRQVEAAAPRPSPTSALFSLRLCIFFSVALPPARIVYVFRVCVYSQSAHAST